MAKTTDLGAVSSYAIAVENGFEGTQEEWVQFLVNAGKAGGYADQARDAANRAEAVAMEFPNSMAPTYSASSTYAVGDYVMYDELLYKCTTAIETAEAWTAAHWTQVPLGNDVRDLKSAIGELWMSDFACSIGSISESGSDITSTTRIRTDDYIYVNKGAVIKATAGSVFICVVIYDDSKNFVSSSGFIVLNPSAYTMPQDGYIRILVRYYDNRIFTESMLAEWSATIKISTIAVDMGQALAKHAEALAQAVESGELKKDIDKVILGDTVNIRQATNFIYFDNIRADIDDYIRVRVDLTSGSSSGISLYANTTNASDSISDLPIGEDFIIKVDRNITQLIGYVRGYSSAVFSGTATTLSTLARVDVNIEKIKRNQSYLPPYSELMVESINSKLESLQNSKSASIAMFTDIHVDGDTMADVTQNAFSVSIDALNTINSTNRIDMCLLNGDYIYNRVDQTKERTLGEYSTLRETLAKVKTPLFVSKGNHDVNDIAGTTDQFLTDEELYKCILKMSSDYVGDYGHLEKAYGYCDIPNKKIRCIFINTSDVPFILNGTSITYPQQDESGVGNEQINFIANALKFTETGWGVLFFSHYALQNGSGIVPSGQQAEYLNLSHGGTQLLGVIEAYRNKGTYVSNVSSGDFQYSVNVDFTDNESSEVIAMISGHSHADRTDVVNGIRMISSMASSYIYTSYDANGNPVGRVAGRESETSWDIFTIDRESRKIYAIRYGAGSDREFTY